MNSQLLHQPVSRFFSGKPFIPKQDENLEIYSTDPNEITQYPDDSFKLMNLKPKINDLPGINHHLQIINKKLHDHGLLVCSCETIAQRKKRLRQKYGKRAYLLLPFDFIYKRIIPKTAGLKKLYSLITHGKNRVLSKAEVLGRLYYNGFKLVKIEEVDNMLHLIMKKTSKPSEAPPPSTGIFFKKKSAGRNGDPVYIYKIRTMHPYAEYIRNLILKQNGYSTSGNGIGKIDNDFRVTSWGRVLRKYWLDETPQIINILKRDLKIVGIRPLSKSFLNEYPKDFLKERMKHRMGLLPPYAAHIHKSVEEYIESERKYLAAYSKHPVLTDIKYFFWILYNILSNKIRSQ